MEAHFFFWSFAALVCSVIFFSCLKPTTAMMTVIIAVTKAAKADISAIQSDVLTELVR